MSLSNKSYICLESDKHVHVDFSGTVKHGFRGRCLFLGHILYVLFFSFSSFFRLHNDSVWHCTLSCKLPAVSIKLVSETQSSKNVR